MTAPRTVPQTEVVIAVMARAPSEAGKTRLLDPMGVSDGTPLRRAILLDTLETVARVEGVHRVVLYTPQAQVAQFHDLLPGSYVLVPQRDGDLGDRMIGAFDDLRALGYHAAVVMGSDLPTLPERHLQMAVEHLRRTPDAVVIGPSADGGYNLIGLTRPAASLFVDMPWSTDAVARLTLERAAHLGLNGVLLPEWPDVDTPEDFGFALRQAGANDAGAARHTRAWLRTAPASVQALLGLERPVCADGSER
ncbi:MAG: TIGR04282 family arsenosugar biosynthesis glycosyltransferase [Acidobacteriota bacterium]